MKAAVPTVALLFCPRSKGSVKNKFAEFVLRFAPDLVAND